MAFPSVEAISPASDNATGGAATTGSSAATSHAVVLPATVSAGALLVVVGRVSVAGTVAVTGGGWTIVQDSSDGSDDVSFWMYRNTAAAGTEDGTSITVTHGSGKMTAVALSITGAADPATRAPEASTVAVGTTGTTLDPTTCTPTGGAKDYLWIWFGCWDGEQTTPLGSNPTNYTSNKKWETTGTSGLPATNNQTAIATRTNNAASEDAGSWTISGAPTGSAAWVIGVHPVPPPTTTGTAKISLAAGTEPDTRTLHSIKVRARTTAGSGVLRAALYEGSTNITDTAPGYLEQSLTTSLANYTLAIADADAAAIGSYANLDIWIWGYSALGGSIVYEVDQVWLEIPATSAVTKAVTPAAISTTSAVTASVQAQHRIVPAAITATSAVTAAAVRALHRIVPAAISTTSAITVAVLRGRRVVPAAISTTSSVTAAITKTTGGVGKAVTPAAISTTSAVTATVQAQHRIVPAAISSTSTVGALTLRAQRRVAPAAITATSAASAAVTKTTAGTTQTGTARISLAPGGPPTSRTLHSIKLRARVTSGAGKLRAQLWQGGSQIGSGYIESAALTTSLADYTLAVPDADAATITDYSDLEIRFWGFCVAGGSIVFEVDQLWLELPATSPKAVAPAAITATSAVTAAVGKQAGPRAVIPAAISATSNVTAWLPTGLTAQIGLGFIWLHGPAVARAVTPSAVTATSAVTASLRALRRVAPAAITATSAITAALRALHRIIPAAISASSAVSAAITKPGSGPRAVAPAAISTTSNVTASIQRARGVVPAAISASSSVTSAAVRALHRITPAAITASSAVTAAIGKAGFSPKAVTPAAIASTSAASAGLVARRAVAPAAITATSNVSVSVRALHRIIPAAITSTSAASASVTKPGPGPKQVAPAAITSTSAITVSTLRVRRALVPGAVTATSDISVSLQARHRIVVSAITSTSTITAGIGRRITLGLGSITATSNITAVIKGGLLLEQGVLVGFLGRPVGGYIPSGRNGKIDEVELTPR